MATRLGLGLPEHKARTTPHRRLPAVADGRLAPPPRERLTRFHGDSAARLPTDPGLTHHASPLVHYLLLSTRHPDGRGKAEYLSRLGYSQDTAPELDPDLREQILSLDAQPGRPSPYGQKYEILGPLTGPNGKNAWVRTIWIVLTGETAPRLVTLIPAEKP